METAARAFIETNREKLKDFGASLVFLDWADVALEQGAEPSDVLFAVMTFNMSGPDESREVYDDTIKALTKDETQSILILEVKRRNDDENLERQKAA